MGLSFVSAPLFLHELGSTHYGLLALLTALVTPFGLLELGMSEATVKYVSESLGKEDYAQAQKYINTTLCFNLLVGTIGGTAIVLLAGILAGDLFKLTAQDQDLAIHCMVWVALNWAFTRTRQTFLGVASALRNYKAISGMNFTYQLTFVLSGLGILFAGGGLLQLVRVQALVSAIGVIGWYWLLRILAPRLVIRPVIDGASFKVTLQFGFWQLCNSLGDLFTQQAQRWQLGAGLSLAAVGYYNLSYQLGSMVYSVSSRVGQVFFPEISRLQGGGREAEAATLLVRVNWMLSCIQIPCFVVIFTLSTDLLLLWTGPEVAAASGGVLRILCAGLAVASLFAVPSYYLLGIGKPKWLAVMSAVQGSITVGTAALLIPRIGINGAGWALTAGTITHVIILVLIWRRFLRHLVPCLDYLASTFGSILSGILCAGVSSVLHARHQTPITWGGTIGTSCLIGSCSLVSCLAVSLLLPGGQARHLWFKTGIRKGMVSINARLRLA